MKNSILALLLTTTVSVVIFQSCSNNSQATDEMQDPIVQNADSASSKTSDSAAKNISALNLENMQSAFKGETTASAKYAAYSKKAEEEGFHEIALLFKAASTSEKIHANNHKAVLEDAGQTVPEIKPEFTVNTTAENLKDAIAGEGYEISTMYPEFITNANTAGNQLSLISLNYAYKTEQKHKPFYEKALAALESNNVKSLTSVYYVCPTCGNTYETTASKRCGLSMTSSEKFIRISTLNS